jgi:hypothetical protein
MNLEDDFMEIGNTGLIPIGEGLFWDKKTNSIVELKKEDEDDAEEDAKRS